MTCIELIKRRKELWELNMDIEEDREFREAVADRITSKKGEALRKEIFSNPENIIELFFVIVDKNQNVVPFFLNVVQKEFLDVLNQAVEDYRTKKRNHLKFLVLKGRQQGFTSFITAYQLACTITRKNFSGFTIADSSDNSSTIFEDKAKYPYSQLPEVMQPEEKYNTRREMLFNKLNSKWRVATAGNKEVGRSKTINFLHASECAFWDSIQRIFGGLGQALTKDCIQILETTANGFNEYRTLWSEAERKENNYEPLFYPWWKTPEYRLEFENAAAEKEFKTFVLGKSNDISKKLFWLVDFHKLEWEQVYWYYGKAKDLKELLPQEYPCTPLEAFLSSGQPVFDNEKVLKRKEYLERIYKLAPPKRYRLSYEYKNEKIIDSSIKLVEDNSGELIVYEQPLENYHYVLGGDTAEGGTDYCVGQVVNNVTGRQVAKWRGRTDTDLFAKQMYCLGKLYNNALIGIEVNFDLHPVKELERLGYDNQYMREHMDSITGQVAMKYGFNTNKATRPVIVGDLVEIVREETHLINDVETLSEMLVFIKNDQGRAEASEGEHDDTVMSLSIAYKIRNQQETTVKIKEEKKQSLPHALTTEEEIEVIEPW